MWARDASPRRKPRTTPATITPSLRNEQSEEAERNEQDTQAEHEEEAEESQDQASAEDEPADGGDLLHDHSWASMTTVGACDHGTEGNRHRHHVDAPPVAGDVLTSTRQRWMTGGLLLKEGEQAACFVERGCGLQYPEADLQIGVATTFQQAKQAICGKGLVLVGKGFSLPK